MPHKDPEARRQYERERYAQLRDSNDEKHERKKERVKKWQEDNPEKKLAIWRDYYNRNLKAEPTPRKLPTDPEERKVWNNAYMKKWNQSEKGQKARVARSVRRRCGLTIDEYNAAYDAQGGKCKICGVEAGRYDKRLAVDHCHKSGRFRALLCHRCNSGLGYFLEDVSLMRNAIAYLESVRVD